jgi:hypothetical protein
MSRVLLVLACVTVFAGCASSAPQPSAAPSASVSSATVNPRLSARAYCFESRGVWRPTAGVCEYEVP